MLTDVGVVRDHNEDAAFVDPKHHYFVVADGMGGHAAGEVASAMAVDTVRNALDDAAEQITGFADAPDEEGRKALVALLEQAVRAAHKAVFERGATETDKQGMGTTLDVVLIAGPEAFVAHVGDSRTYLIRDGRASQITTDHTVAEVLVIEGKLSLEEAQISPLRTILVNAIGVAPDVGVEMAHVQLRKGDLLLLCSDGLHDYFPVEQELAEYIVKEEPDEALDKLVELAKERGGHDNITGVLVDVVECDVPSDGVVEATRSPDFSDGIPAAIERDDTLPVDVGEDSAPLVTRHAKGADDEGDEDEGEGEGDEGEGDEGEGEDEESTEDMTEKVAAAANKGEEKSKPDALKATQPMQTVAPPPDLEAEESASGEDEDEAASDESDDESDDEDEAEAKGR